MFASQIQKQIVDEKAACLIRPRKEERVKGQPIQYDVKEYGLGGNKRGWVLLDLFTASAMQACYNALSTESQASWDKIPITKLVDFTWEHVI